MALSLALIPEIAPSVLKLPVQLRVGSNLRLRVNFNPQLRTHFSTPLRASPNLRLRVSFSLPLCVSFSLPLRVSPEILQAFHPPTKCLQNEKIFSVDYLLHNGTIVEIPGVFRVLMNNMQPFHQL